MDKCPSTLAGRLVRWLKTHRESKSESRKPVLAERNGKTDELLQRPSPPSLLPRPLWSRVGVGVDGRRVGECRRSGAVGVGRVRWGGIARHHVVGLDVSGRGGGGGGGGQVEVEGSTRGRGGRRRGRGRDPLQDHVRVELGLGAVEARHGHLQQTLLTPV